MLVRFLILLRLYVSKEIFDPSTSHLKSIWVQGISRLLIISLKNFYANALMGHSSQSHLGLSMKVLQFL